MQILLGLLLFFGFVQSTVWAEEPFEQTRNNIFLSCTTTSSSFAVTPDNADGDYRSMVVTNTGTAVAFIEKGSGDVVADPATTATPVLPDSAQVMKLARSQTHVACKTQSGTAAIIVSPGRGQ